MYHLHTDGQSECLNQEVEVYLRAFCSQWRDNWVKWLPIAEYALNARQHSATGHSPFFLTYGYKLQFHVPANPDTYIPAANAPLADTLTQLVHTPPTFQSGSQAREDTSIRRGVLS